MLNKIINCFRLCRPKTLQNSTYELTRLLEESKRKRTEAAREEYEKRHGKPIESKI